MELQKDERMELITNAIVDNYDSVICLFSPSVTNDDYNNLSKSIYRMAENIMTGYKREPDLNYKVGAQFEYALKCLKAISTQPTIISRIGGYADENYIIRQELVLKNLSDDLRHDAVSDLTDISILHTLARQIDAMVQPASDNFDMKAANEKLENMIDIVDKLSAKLVCIHSKFGNDVSTADINDAEFIIHVISDLFQFIADVITANIDFMGSEPNMATFMYKNTINDIMIANNNNEALIRWGESFSDIVGLISKYKNDICVFNVIRENIKLDEGFCYSTLAQQTINNIEEFLNSMDSIIDDIIHRFNVEVTGSNMLDLVLNELKHMLEEASDEEDIE